MASEYEALLKRAKEKLPEQSAEQARFDVPNVRGHIQGNKTVISNFHQIATYIGREPEHLFKYVLKELATPGEIKQNEVLIGRKVPAHRVNEKISQYVKYFVLCPVCGKPDTKLTKESKINFLKCQACGARNSVQVKL